ncbi:MAG: DNA replication complex subunit Gins51 [Promethearchaeota archaeon]
MSTVLTMILDAWREETISKSFSKLPPNMLEIVREIISGYGERLNEREQNSLQARVIKREIEMLQYVVKDLFTLRRMKIERAVKTGDHVDSRNLLPFEKEFYDSLVVSRENYNSKVSLTPYVSPAGGAVGENTLIYIREAGKGIVDFNLRFYGPFKREDVVYLPKENADIMVKGERAKVVSLQK